jgi:hypothetical protein
VGLPSLPFLYLNPALEVNDHAIYQAATTALDVEQQTLLMEIMQAAAAAGAPPGGQ